jgi:hypothetical protein
MIRIQVGQLIYSNVEAEASPAKTRGYQIVSCSESLDREEAIEIESRLIFRLEGDHPVKHVFFVTARGHAVIARIVPLDKADRFGREGLYLAHALLLKERDFRDIGCDVFGLFRAAGFLDRLEDALAQDPERTGRIPSLDVDLGVEPEIPAPAVSKELLAGLLTLAARATAARQRRTGLAIAGTGEEVFRFLEWIFSLLPPGWRYACHFDTHFTDASLTDLPYWAIGGPVGARFPEGTNRILARADAIEAAGPLERGRSLQAWLERVMASGEANEDVMMRLEIAAAWCTWMEGVGDPPPRGAAAARTFLELFELYGAELSRWARENCARSLGPNIYARIGERLGAQGGGGATSVMEAAYGGASSPLVAQWLWEALDDPETPATDAEMKEVETLLKRVDHEGLRLLVLLWRGQAAEFMADIRHRSDAEFKEFLRRWLPRRRARRRWGYRGYANGLLLGVFLEADEARAATLLKNLADLTGCPGAKARFDERLQAKGKGRSDEAFTFDAAPDDDDRRRLLMVLRHLLDRAIAES